MKINHEQTEYISAAFKSMKDKEDLLNLLNYAKTVLFEGKTVPFEKKQLNYYIVRQNQNKKYKSFSIKKKSGGLRTIHSPVKGLKIIQSCLNLILQSVFKPHMAAYGFVPGKSIVDNARIHVGANYVYNIDLKDFFPSIKQARVWSTLKQPPFSLNGERQQLANIIAALCCTELELEAQTDESGSKLIENVLPQGAPTSPILTNVVCQRLDYLLSGVANRFGLKYSRYADDITFSSLHNIFTENTKRGKLFIDELKRIILEQGFEIKANKTRLQRKQYRQEVTGLIVNQKVNVGKRYIQKLRWWLFLWEKYGYEAAYTRFIKDYRLDKGHVKKQQPNMTNVISGKLEYLKMVKGINDPQYKRLYEIFATLVNLTDKPVDNKIPAKQSENSYDVFLKVLIETKDLKNAVKFLKETI